MKRDMKGEGKVQSVKQEERHRCNPDALVHRGAEQASELVSRPQGQRNAHLLPWPLGVVQCWVVLVGVGRDRSCVGRFPHFWELASSQALAVVNLGGGIS